MLKSQTSISLKNNSFRNRTLLSNPLSLTLIDKVKIEHQSSGVASLNGSARCLLGNKDMAQRPLTKLTGHYYNLDERAISSYLLHTDSGKKY